jgi:AcrR family transcriptional regulator
VSDREKRDAESRIIAATIACIEAEGIEAATIRKIASYAGVNSAAINYYFRTKERLIERALEVTLDNAFDWSDFESSSGAGPRERAVAILDDLVQGALAYPGLSRAHFMGPITEGDYSGLAVERLNEFAERLHDDLRARGATLPGDQLRTAVVQLMVATMVYAALAPGLLHRFHPVDFHDPVDRHSYIATLVEALIPEGGP